MILQPPPLMNLCRLSLWTTKHLATKYTHYNPLFHLLLALPFFHRPYYKIFAKERELINGYLTSVFLVGTSTSMKVTNLNVNDLKIASHQA
jgi:hypothetical protein